MLKRENEGLKISVSHPTQQLTHIVMTIQEAYNAKKRYDSERWHTTKNRAPFRKRDRKNGVTSTKKIDLSFTHNSVDGLQ